MNTLQHPWTRIYTSGSKSRVFRTWDTLPQAVNRLELTKETTYRAYVVLIGTRDLPRSRHVLSHSPFSTLSAIASGKQMVSSALHGASTVSAGRMDILATASVAFWIDNQIASALL